MISFLVSDNPHSRLGKKLEKAQLVSRNQFRDLATRAKREDRHVVEVLFEHIPTNHDRILRVVGEHFNAPPALLHKRVISRYILNLIPKEIAEQHSVIVFKKIKDVIHVAVTNPENTQIIEFVKKKTGLTPKVFIASPDEISQALKKYEEEIATEFAKIIQDSINEALAIHDTVEKMAQYVPIVKMVDTIIERALTKRASDIHIEPDTLGIAVRFRIDGQLHRIVALPTAILPPLVTRIKILANLKIDEHRIPQDGRFKFHFKNRDVAIRVSMVPTLHGTKAAMRLLDTQESEFTLPRLGFNQRDLKVVKTEIKKPHGMILVTGPTGSGKTTTLYTLLRMLNKEHVNICTIEDPIEYGIQGINQTQINPPAGLTFANGLRSLLRQDPNIIMVGEIRDAETAEIAVHAAMTGHLVLSTLHTNNAFIAFQRLTEMGVQRFLAGSVINLIIGQRLVRRICPHCKASAGSTPKIIEQYAQYLDLKNAYTRLKTMGLLASHNAKAITDIRFYTGKGCEKCSYSGYQGRVGIYELVAMNAGLHQTVLSNPDASAVQNIAVKHGTLTMAEDGILKVIGGLTTFEEVARTTKE